MALRGSRTMSVSQPHPLLVTTAHLDELRLECASLTSEAKASAIADTHSFAESLVKEQSEHFSELLATSLAALEERLQTCVMQTQEGISRLVREAQRAAAWDDVRVLADDLRQEIKRVSVDVSDEAGARQTLGVSLDALRGEVSSTAAAVGSLGVRQRQDAQEHLARVEALRCEMRQEVERRSSVMERSVSQARRDLGTRIESLESVKMQMVETSFSSIEVRLQALESLPTRRVEWLVSSQASELDTSVARSWWSPKFMAAGQGYLQLELQLYAGGADRSTECKLQLWGSEACEGAKAIVRLCVGAAVEELQHRFAAGVPCPMRRCSWQEAVDWADDELCVGVEILEGLHVLCNGPEPCLAEVTPALVAPAPHPDLPTTGLGEGSAGGGGVRGGGATARGSWRLFRHVCPSAADRFLSLRDEWDDLRSRMISRVEWRLEWALMLQQRFPKGECLCSSAFRAGGAEQLQLMFYPSGDEDARACYCSFFLACPGRSTVLQCWLSVGKHRREAHRSLRRPDLLGRSNFCLFEGCADRGSDALVLTLEIADAQQLDAEASRPSPPPKAVPWPDVATAPTTLTLEAGREGGSSTGHEHVTQSSSKLQGIPGRISLEDVKQLPSIWTSKPGAGAHRSLPPLWTSRTSTTPESLPAGYLQLDDLPASITVAQRRPHHPRGSVTPRGRGCHPSHAKNAPLGSARASRACGWDVSEQGTAHRD